MTLSLCEITGAVETRGKREEKGNVGDREGRRSLLKGSWRQSESG